VKSYKKNKPINPWYHVYNCNNNSHVIIKGLMGNPWKLCTAVLSTYLALLTHYDKNTI